ncbi:putative addiction module killer protein [Marinospirillum celere]|uniref:Putative addiction module killer protein n=1 Tax=Marinospirillum celere TaxID=1122252 RepID=A0A1I1E9E1_9GAMM|nr:type II toxin-antitoxin system RelE/ParE family toxin [Marinospirillum celere]SFB83326.1 putative addiction module killer protein [Marinospirillum celere]
MIIKKLVVEGRVPFDERLKKIKDARAVARIIARIRRLESGNPGDHKALSDGLYELRIDVGTGWRVYYTKRGDQLILLALVGSKKTQTKDIKQVLSWLN